MYELFILGILIDGPKHGYLLHQIINRAIGPVRQMSWGALYPLLRRLEADGLAAPEGVEGGDEGGRQRKLYRLTEAGRVRFHELMLEDTGYSTDDEDLFTMKLCNFAHISRAAQLTILQRYREFLLFQARDLRSNQERHIRDRASCNPAMNEARRGSILTAIDHRMHVLQADLDWVQREIAARQGTAPADPGPRRSSD